MKKTPLKLQRSVHNLGELILLVNRCSRNKIETLATVADLIESGRVRFTSHGQNVRGRVC
jgi:hypothetical protein